MLLKVMGVSNGYVLEKECGEDHSVTVIEERGETNEDELHCSRNLLYAIAEELGLPMGAKGTSQVRIIIENNGMELGH